MELLFKQKVFSWLDSYDIYNKEKEVVYTIQGKLSWGHKLIIMDAYGNEIGRIEEKVLSLLPCFIMYLNDEEIGVIQKELSFLKPRFHIDCLGWKIEGDLFEWNYSIKDEWNHEIASVYKEVFTWADTYVLNVKDEEHAIFVLMIILAIDAAKCSRNG